MQSSGTADSSEFFTRLLPFTEFDRVVDPSVYAQAPEDWWLVITDVQGSTAAIDSGRYKEVNLAGASSIAAVTNTCTTPIPFVFGGDGATFLIPPGFLEAVKAQLASTQVLVRANFQLGLRAGFVPVAELNRQNAPVQVAKFQLSPGNELAMFRGGGAALAEKLVKKGPLAGGAFVLPMSESDLGVQPNVEGLSCRWDLVRARTGKVLSVLVVARNAAGSDATYGEVLQALHRILGDDRLAGNPVRKSRPTMALSGEGFRFEARNIPGLSKFLPLALIAVWLFRTLLKIVFALDVPLGGVQPKRYLNETAINADYKKFDDTLRFVIDCNDEQASAIQAFLEALHRKQRIFYGIHPSDFALMTCLVKSASQNQHVHFIDGGDGGYAAAAKQLKKQMLGVRPEQG